MGEDSLRATDAAAAESDEPGGRTSGDDSGANRAGADERETARRDANHLADVPDGSGCTEIWEELSERRENDGSEGGGAESG